ncbi:hypothetical protein BOTBODRAFT_182462 [Botryobasidium botryosum FD-172 SS1]|uniref:Uncharacterized protein n=1 Tax=Botryobasidium botryosum (strain FD-172 SS1) TaxID=930990 RepID=A0A067LQP9_BOTB1|nr:hypothetical protein BOTBODRAFT_182462 [Botryobasidium botryosum FD-172 SS1]
MTFQELAHRAAAFMGVDGGAVVEHADALHPTYPSEYHGVKGRSVPIEVEGGYPRAVVRARVAEPKLGSLGETHSSTIATDPPDAMEGVIVAKAKACSRCGDSGWLLPCQTQGCPHAWCFKKSNGILGCLPEKQLPAGFKFTCPPCLGVKKLPTPYPTLGELGLAQIHPTTIAPLLVHTMRYDGEASTYPRDHLMLQFKEEYLRCPELLHLCDIEMKRGASQVTKLQKRVNPAISWAAALHQPFDYLAFIDTHSCDQTGELCYSTDPDGYGLTAPLAQLLRSYGGVRLATALAQSSGLKGLVLLTCGSAFTNAQHYAGIMEVMRTYVFLLDLPDSPAHASRCRSQFDFILGFSGDIIIPRFWMPAITAFLVRTFHRHRSKIDLAFYSSFCTGAMPLTTSPAVLMLRRGKDIIATETRYSDHLRRVWGLRPPTCPKCEGGFTELKPTVGGQGHAFCMFKCPVCPFRSAYMKRPQWQTPASSHSYFFTNPFPLSPDDSLYISRNLQPATSVAPVVPGYAPPNPAPSAGHKKKKGRA